MRCCSEGESTVPGHTELLGTAEEITGMVLYLASDEGAFCTGQNFVIDGGITI